MNELYRDYMNAMSAISEASSNLIAVSHQLRHVKLDLELADSKEYAAGVAGKTERVRKAHVFIQNYNLEKNKANKEYDVEHAKAVLEDRKLALRLIEWKMKEQLAGGDK